MGSSMVTICRKCAVDMVDHGGDGGGFAAAGWAGNENQAVGIVSNCFYNRRQVKGFKRGESFR